MTRLGRTRHLAIALTALLLAGSCSSSAGTPASSRPATPLPTRTPAFSGGVPSAKGPVQSGFTRYSGTVTDAQTGAPIFGACVYAGPPAGCPSPSLISDEDGAWAFDFPSGVTWEFNFEHPDYKPVNHVTGTTIDVKLEPK